MTSNFPELSALNETVTSSWNIHDESIVMTSPHLIILLVLSIPLMLCITFGNAVVMGTIYRERRLHTPTNCILASLACADFLTGALTMPLELYTDARTDTMECRAITYALAPSYFLSGVSLMHQIAVTSDRLVAVSRSLRYYELVTRQRVTMVIVSLWLGGAFPAGAFLYVWLTSLKADNLSKGACGGGVYYSTSSISNFETSLGILVVIALFLLTIFNIYIWCVAKRQAKQIDAQLRVMGIDANQKRRRIISLQATKTVLAIVGTFVISWTPFTIYSLLSWNMYVSNLSYSHKYIINQACFYLICVNSAINPVIYGWKNKEFRRSIRQLLVRCSLTRRLRATCCADVEGNTTIVETISTVNDTNECSLAV